MRRTELVKKVFLTSSQTRPTSLGSRLKRLRLAAAHSLALARLRAEFAIDRQENMRFCRAEMPSYCVKALENTQSILCGLFLVCEHFCSGRTASHRTALDFRGIFVLLDAGGLSPAKDKRAKSTEKTYLSDVCALVNRRFPLRIQNIPSPMEAGCCFFIRVWRSRDRRRGNIPW